MKKSCFLFFGISICFAPFFALAQDTTKLYFSSSAGLLKPLSTFAKSYNTSLALSSGIEYRFAKRYFLLGEVGLNAVKYNQQFIDKSSAYLFQNTNSSVISLGLNVGRIIQPKPAESFSLSPYVGIGYINVGEPRLLVDKTSQIIRQQVKRMQGLFTKIGTRFSYKTNAKAIQNVFFDVSYWNAYLLVQQSKPQAFIFVFGTKIGF